MWYTQSVKNYYLKEMEQNKELEILHKDLIFAYLQCYPLYILVENEWVKGNNG